MKKHFLTILLMICIFISADLSGNTDTPGDAKHISPSLIISAGINYKSGIIENPEVDAVTGATKIGINAGVKTEIHIANNFHFFGTGLEYNYIPQEIKYNDPSNGINGKREFGLHLIRLPVTYNMHFFNNDKGNPVFVTRLGLSFSYLLFDNIKDTGTLPSYSMNKWEMGPLIGFAFYPLYDTGIFFDMYRGSRQLYKDKYHTKDGEGNISGFSFGVQQRFPDLFN